MTKRNFWKDGFTAEDFECFCLMDNVEHGVKCMAKRQADHANEILREELEKQAVVYFDDEETMNEIGYFEGNIKRPKEYHTHTARLVAIEEIKK